MTALAQFASLEVGLVNSVSEGAAAATRDLDKVEAAAERAQAASKQLEGGLRVVGQSFDQLSAKVDASARAEVARQAIVARAERQSAAIVAAAQREGRSQEELARALSAVTARRDADIARAQQQARVQQAQQQALVGGAASMDRFVAANDNATRASGNLRAALGQVGFQVQDVATQISMGQNALMAFGVQGAQLAGVFGPTGAMAGAGLMIGVIAAQLLGVTDGQREVNQALERADTFYRAVTEAAQRYQRGLRSEADEIAQLTERYRNLDEQRRQYEMRQAEARRAELLSSAGSLGRDINSELGRTQMEAVRQVQAEQEALFRARQMGTAPTRSADDARAALAAIYEFRAEVEASGRVSEDVLLRLQERFRQTASTGGEFADQLNDSVSSLDRFVPRAEDLDRRLTPIERVLAILAGQSLPAMTGGINGAGTAAATAAGQVASLVAQAQALAAAARENPAAGLNARIQRVQEDAEALARGGLERLEAVRGLRTEAERAAKHAEDAERDYRQSQERAQRGAQDIEREIEQNRSLWALRGQELARQESENTRREAEARKRAQEAAAAGRAASRAAARDDAAEARDMARVIQDIERDREALMQRGQATYAATRTEAEKYTERLGELRNQLAAGAIDQDTFNRAVAAADPAAKRAQEAATSWENTIAGAMTRAFERGEDAGRSFLESIASGVKSLAATIASQLVFRMAVVPVVNQLGGMVGLGNNLLSAPNSPIGGLSLGGLFGGGSQIVADTGSTTNGLVEGAQRAGGLGLTGSNGWLSGAYNGVSQWANGLFMSGNSVAVPAGQLGLGSVDALAASLPASPTAATTGNALAGYGGAMTVAGSALGVGAGLYGAYSGFQRGGVGGYTQAAGGLATAGLSAYAGIMGSMAAVPVYGWIAAAVLAIVGALLPGQKPSGKGQEFRYDLASGEVERNGLRSNGRYSAENASQAEGATMQIASMAQQISERLGGMRIGGNIAVGVTSSRGDGPGTLYLDIVGNKAQFSNDEAGAKQLADRAAELILNEFRKTATGDYGGILRASPTVEALDQNLAWYEQVYKSFSQTGEAASAFAQGLAQVDARFTELVNKANELSLSSNDLLSAWQKEKDRMTAERDLQVRGFDIGLDIRSLQARGANDNELLQQATLMQFDWAARQQIEQAKATLESWGLSAEDVASRIARNEVVLAEERLRIQQEYAERAAAIAAQLGEAQGQALQKTAAEMAAARQQAAQSGLSVVTSLRSYVAGLSAGPESPGTAMDRLAAAGRQFDAIFGAAYAGDANSISGFQGAAETYRSAARDVFGGGQGYADAIAKIADRSSSIVGLGAEGITQAFIRENDRQNFDRLNDTLDGGFDSLREVIEGLRRDLNQVMMRPAA